jgi:hypothetical protein
VRALLVTLTLLTGCAAANGTIPPAPEPPPPVVVSPDTFPFTTITGIPDFAVQMAVCPNGAALAYGVHAPHAYMFLFGEQMIERFLILNVETMRIWGGEVIAGDELRVTDRSDLATFKEQYPHPCDYLTKVRT